MKNIFFKKNQLMVALTTITFSSFSYAELVNSSSIQPSNDQAQQYTSKQYQSNDKLAWGGSDSLAKAKAVMYSTIAKPNQLPSYSSSYSQSYKSKHAYNTIANSQNKYKKVYSDSKNVYNDSNVNNSYNYGSSHNSYNNNAHVYQSNSQNYNHSQYNSQHNNGSTGFGGKGYDKLNISTRSRGVMVVDLVSGKPIYEKNANTSRPIASISKLMTGMVILDAGLDMREEIVLTSFDFAGNRHTKKSRSRLKVGDRLNRAEMLLMTLMKSENPAAKSLARTYPGGYSAFMRAMNDKARSLGMTKAFFGDPTGLDTRNVASPSGLVKMLKAAGKYDVIRNFSTTASYDFYIANYSHGDRVYTGRNTSRLVREKIYPISMSKTGFINEAGRCVVMETQVNGRPAVVVILGASSSANRWSDAENILNSLQYRMI